MYSIFHTDITNSYDGTPITKLINYKSKNCIMTRDKYSVSQDFKKNATRPSKTKTISLSHLKKVEALFKSSNLYFEY
jgi:hypothetical protein